MFEHKFMSTIYVTNFYIIEYYLSKNSIRRMKTSSSPGIIWLLLYFKNIKYIDMA